MGEEGAQGLRGEARKGRRNSLFASMRCVARLHESAISYLTVVSYMASDRELWGNICFL